MTELALPTEHAEFLSLLPRLETHARIWFRRRNPADREEAVADQAAFNIDFPAWLATLPDVKRRVAELLAHGHGTTEAATLAGLSSGRVSQLRRELAAAWSAFHAGS